VGENGVSSAVVIVIVIIVAVVGVGGYLFLKGEGEGKITLSIENVKLCSGVRGGRDYTVQPNATFQQGDIVFLYFEATGFKAREVDNEFEVHVKLTEVWLYNPDGSPNFRAENPQEFHETYEQAPTYAWFHMSWGTYTWTSLGQYKWKFTITDAISGATATGTAIFVLQGGENRFTLTTSVNPPGAGTVSLSPPGGTYDSGTSVTLTASAASGYSFNNWSGDASGTSATVSITMDSNKSVTANFSSEGEGEVPPLTVTDFQAGSTSGTAEDPGCINDGGPLSSTVFLDAGDYCEVDLGSKFRVRQYRYHGALVNEDQSGTYKIQYWDGSSWSDWDTGISTRSSSWSDWITPSAGTITTDRVRIVATKIQSGFNWMGELEMKY